MANQKRPQADLRGLVDELLEESHGLRMRYEDFSRYTEGKVAEFVLTKKQLNHQLAELEQRKKWLSEKVLQLEAARDHLVQQRDHVLVERDGLLVERDGLLVERDGLLVERDGLLLELVHARGDIGLLHDHRAKIQDELVRISQECALLQHRVQARTEQRDRLRERVRALEASRWHKLGQRIRKLLRR